MLSKGAVTKSSDIEITFWLSFVVTPETTPNIFLRLGFSVGLMFTWLHMAPFREFKGHARGHFVTQKKANRQNFMLTTSLERISSLSPVFEISRARAVLSYTYVTIGKKKAAKHLRRKYLFKSSFYHIYTHNPIFSRLHNVPWTPIYW